MNEHLKQRILRRLEDLSDERAYQVLDFVEFLDSKYAGRSQGGGLFTRLTETAEDTMRAAGLPLKAITGTMGLVESAGKVMRGVVAAAQSVVDEATGAAGPAAPAASSAPGRAAAPHPDSRRSPPPGTPPGDDGDGDDGAKRERPA